MRKARFQAECRSMMDGSTGTAGTHDRPALSLVEEGIETALNLPDVGVWEHFLPEDRIQFSDGFYRLVGLDPAEGRRNPAFWRERMHPEEYGRLQFEYSEFIAGRVPLYETIYRVRHEQGHWVSVLSRARWVSRGNDGAGRVALGYVIDVSPRSADFDRLAASEERFRMSISALHGVVYDLDLRTNRSERDGLRRMLGYETLQGDDGYSGWLSIIHPDDRQRFEDKVAAHRQSGADYEIGYRVRHQDGRWRHVRQRATYTLGPDGRPVRAFGVIEDVTDAEAQRQQLHKQAAIIERMSEGVMLALSDGTILFANPAMEKLLGYGPGEIRGKNGHELSFRSADAFAGLLHTIFEGTANDNTSVIDLEGRRKDGSSVPLQGVFSQLNLGERRCVVAVFTDITERKQLERELMQMATRVQQRVGGDLHDGLGQQLAGIAMMLQGLGQRAVQAGAPALRAEVDEIVALVNASIRSTRLLARGLSPVRPTREGLTEGFHELANRVRDTHGLDVTLELDLPPALGIDEHVATNLYYIAQEGVENAVRHANATHVEVRVRFVDEDAELLVVDDGRGFDPLPAARAGMGLRVMQFRAQLVRGYLSVESRPGGGTRLRCRAPARMSKDKT